MVLGSILHQQPNRLKRSCALVLSSLMSDMGPAKAYLAEATPAVGAPQVQMENCTLEWPPLGDVSAQHDDELTRLVTTD